MPSLGPKNERPLDLRFSQIQGPGMLMGIGLVPFRNHRRQPAPSNHPSLCYREDTKGCAGKRLSLSSLAKVTIRLHESPPF